MGSNSNTKDQLEVSSKYPQKILDTALCELWYSYTANSNSANEPLSSLHYHFISPHASGSIENTTMKCLLERSLSDVVNELNTGNFTTLERTTYSYHTANGIAINIFGRNGDIRGIINTFVFSLMSTADITAEKFATLVEMYKDDGKLYAKTGSWVSELCECIVPKYDGSFIERLRCLPRISLAEFQQYVRDYFRAIRIQVFVCGNMNRKQAIGTLDKIVNKFKCNQIDDMSMIAVKPSRLSLGSHYMRCKVPMPRRAGSVVSNFYGFGPTGRSSLHSMAMTDLLCHIAEEPFLEMCDAVDGVRPLNGFFYRPSSDFYVNGFLDGYAFNVIFSESDHTANNIDGLIEQYRKDVIELVEKMSDKKFTESIANTYHNCNADVRNWNEIILQQYDFEFFDAKAKYLAGITKKEFLSFLRLHLFEEQRKLSIQIVRDQFALHDMCKESLCMLSTPISFVGSTPERFMSDLQSFRDEVTENQ